MKYENTLSGFKLWCKDNPNLMTPTIINTKRCDNNVFIELSKGKGINNTDLFGISFSEYSHKQKTFLNWYDENNKSKCFDDLIRAKRRFKDGVIE